MDQIFSTHDRTIMLEKLESVEWNFEQGGSGGRIIKGAVLTMGSGEKLTLDRADAMALRGHLTANSTPVIRRF